MNTDTKTLSERLRIDAEEIAGWGAGNDAADVREAADALDAKDALLREAQKALQITSGALQAGRRGMTPMIAFIGEWEHLGKWSVSAILNLADTALSKLTEATKP